MDCGACWSSIRALINPDEGGSKKDKEKKKKKKEKKGKRKKSITGETELVETVNPMMSAEQLANSPQLSEVALSDPSTSPSTPDGDEASEIHELQDWSSETKQPDPKSSSPSTPLRRLSLMAVFSAAGVDVDEETKDALNHPDPDTDGIEDKGPSGWLHRENEANHENPNEPPWIKVFAVLQEKHLIYKVEHKPVMGENCVGDGFIEIEPMTSVKHTNIHKMGVATSSKIGEHCFSVKELFL